MDRGVPWPVARTCARTGWRQPLRRRASGTRAIPVVLPSSREDPDVHACCELGANGDIVKPVDFEQFTAAVRELGLYWVLLNQPPKV